MEQSNWISVLLHDASCPYVQNKPADIPSGVNSAAWLEFDSPDLSPSDAASVMLSISEYNM